LRALVYAVWSTAAVALVALINPFEVDQWSFDRSAAIWQRVQADTYGKHDSDYEVGKTPGRDDITIVYLDEQSLAKHRGLGLSLREHQDMLDDLVPSPAPGGAWVAPRPRAIFIDIIFSNIAPELLDYAQALPAEGQSAAAADACAKLPARPKDQDTQTAHVACYVATVARITNFDKWRDERSCQSDSVAKLTCILRTGGVPVIFATADEMASPSPQPKPRPPEPTAIDRALDEVALTVPAFASTTGYELVGQIKDGQPSTAAQRLHNGYRLAPAAALYIAYCGIDGAYRGNCPPRTSDNPGGHKPVVYAPGAPFHRGRVPPIDVEAANVAWNDEFNAPAAVKWGIGGSDRSDRFIDMIDRLHGGALALRCRPAGRGIGDFAGRLLKELIPPLFPDDRRPDCPYTHAVPYTDFDSDLITADDRNTIQRDKIVMIAGQYVRSGDWLAGPTRALPGVYYHAMALDNLIKDGWRYQQVAAPVVQHSNLSLATGKTFGAIFVLNWVSGLVIMALNEPALDPARIPAGSQRDASLKGWRRLTATRRRRWLVRIFLFPAPLALLFLAFCLMQSVEPGWIFNFEAAAILLVGAYGATELLMIAFRPLLEEGRRVVRYFDIGDARLFGSDIDAPVKPGEAAE
jgi:hypothetical protein